MPAIHSSRWRPTSSAKAWRWRMAASVISRRRGFDDCSYRDSTSSSSSAWALSVMVGLPLPPVLDPQEVGGLHQFVVLLQLLGRALVTDATTTEDIGPVGQAEGD